MKEFSVKIDPDSWEAGYKAGKEGNPDSTPEGMDGYSWSSGYIEGKADREQDRPHRFESEYRGRDSEDRICDWCEKPKKEGQMWDPKHSKLPDNIKDGAFVCKDCLKETYQKRIIFNPNDPRVLSEALKTREVFREQKRIKHNTEKI